MSDKNNIDDFDLNLLDGDLDEDFDISFDEPNSDISDQEISDFALDDDLAPELGADTLEMNFESDITEENSIDGSELDDFNSDEFSANDTDIDEDLSIDLDEDIDLNLSSDIISNEDNDFSIEDTNFADEDNDFSDEVLSDTELDKKEIDNTLANIDIDTDIELDDDTNPFADNDEGETNFETSSDLNDISINSDDDFNNDETISSENNSFDSPDISNITDDLGLEEDISLTDEIPQITDDDFKMNFSDAFDEETEEDEDDDEKYGVDLKSGPVTFIVEPSKNSIFSNVNIDETIDNDETVVKIKIPEKKSIKIEDHDSEFLNSDLDEISFDNLEDDAFEIEQQEERFKDRLTNNSFDLPDDSEILQDESSDVEVLKQKSMITDDDLNNLDMNSTADSSDIMTDSSDIMIDNSIDDSIDDFEIDLEDSDIESDETQIDMGDINDIDIDFNKNSSSDSDFSESDFSNSELSIEDENIDEDIDIQLSDTSNNDDSFEDNFTLDEELTIDSSFDEIDEPDYTDSEITTNGDLEMRIEDTILPDDNDMPIIDDDIKNQSLSNTDMEFENSISPLTDTDSVFNSDEDESNLSDNFSVDIDLDSDINIDNDFDIETDDGFTDTIEDSIENTIENNQEIDLDMDMDIDIDLNLDANIENEDNLDLVEPPHTVSLTDEINLEDIPKPIEIIEDEEDESIGLSGDELDNIISSTEIIEADADELVQNDDMFNDETIEQTIQDETEYETENLTDNITENEEESETIDLSSFDADLTETSISFDDDEDNEENIIQKIDISSEEEEEIYNSLKSEMATKSDNNSSVPPANDKLKSEVGKVLSYLDQLLDALPEEKIKEFAESEAFELYRKLFEDLNIKH